MHNPLKIMISLSALSTVSVWIGQPQIAHAKSYPIAQAEQVCSLDGRAIAVGDSANCVSPITSQRSLTVIGLGLVTAPADTALLEFRFGSREPLSSTENNPPGLSIQAARQITEEALKPTVNALTSAGVPDRNITIETSSLQAPKLFAKLDKPTQERIQQIVLAVDRSQKSSKQLFLQSIGAGYGVNNCQPLERSARRIALQDAQAQLVTLAQDVKVQLGELLSVVVLPLVGPSSSFTCGSKVGVSASPLPVIVDDATPPYNPSDKPEVQVKSQVSVTHAIKAGK